MSTPVTRDELRQLQRKLRQMQGVCAAGLITIIVLAGSGFTRRDAPLQDEVRTKRLVVVDNRGTPRVVIAEDTIPGRISKTAGILVFDSTGVERGGFGTFSDGRVVFAMDAPRGVGAPMRDRIGMVVGSDGSSYIMLIDNRTRGVVRLESDNAGVGGIRFFDWSNQSEKRLYRKRLHFHGETIDTVQLGN